MKPEDLNIPNLQTRLDAVNTDEGWDEESEYEFDSFYPDYEKDVNQTLRGIFVKKITGLISKQSGRKFDVFVIYTTEHKVVAIRNFDLIAKGLATVKKGDGVRVTYLGFKAKKSGTGGYHEFKVGLKKFEQDPSPEEKLQNAKTLADADDPEARNQIGNYIEIYKSQNFSNDPKPEDIIHLAETDPDLGDTDLSRIKAQLARDLKKEEMI